jgi:hypothetical protein
MDDHIVVRFFGDRFEIVSAPSGRAHVELEREIREWLSKNGIESLVPTTPMRKEIAVLRCLADRPQTQAQLKRNHMLRYKGEYGDVSSTMISAYLHGIKGWSSSNSNRKSLVERGYTYPPMVKKEKRPGPPGSVYYLTPKAMVLLKVYYDGFNPNIIADEVLEHAAGQSGHKNTDGLIVQVAVKAQLFSWWTQWPRMDIPPGVWDAIGGLGHEVALPSYRTPPNMALRKMAMRSVEGCPKEEFVSRRLPDHVKMFMNNWEYRASGSGEELADFLRSLGLTDRQVEVFSEEAGACGYVPEREERFESLKRFIRKIPQ